MGVRRPRLDPRRDHRHDGQDPEGAIAEVLAQPGVVQVHSRNVAWGCYMFTITHAG